jgi:hypothetical protein
VYGVWAAGMSSVGVAGISSIGIAGMSSVGVAGMSSVGFARASSQIASVGVSGASSQVASDKKVLEICNRSNKRSTCTSGIGGTGTLSFGNSEGHLMRRWYEYIGSIWFNRLISE